MAAGLMVVSVGYGTASAEGSDSIKGDGQSIGSFSFQAKNSGDDPFAATGYFKSQGPFPVTPFAGFNGPISCLVVDGNKAGFIYTIADDSKPVPTNMDVKVTVVEADNGSNGRIGFSFAAPKGTFKDCNPGGQTNPVTAGSIEVNGSED